MGSRTVNLAASSSALWKVLSCTLSTMASCERILGRRFLPEAVVIPVVAHFLLVWIWGLLILGVEQLQAF